MDSLTQRIAAELTVDMISDSIWKAVAAEIGTMNLIKLMYLLNGTDIYIPKPERTLIPARDALIKKESNGYNHHELAARYGLSTNYVRKLCGESLVIGQCSFF